MSHEPDSSWPVEILHASVWRGNLECMWFSCKITSLANALFPSATQDLKSYSFILIPIEVFRIFRLLLYGGNTQELRMISHACQEGTAHSKRVKLCAIRGRGPRKSFNT